MLPSDCLVLALEDTQELLFADVRGRELGRIAASGFPRFPAARPGGGLAYVAITSASEPWQVVVVVVDAAGTPIDVIPGAAVFAAPVWSADGQRLLFLRGDSGAAEIVEWAAADGTCTVLKAGETLRSAAWDAEGRLIWSAGGEIRAEGRAEPISEVAAAAGLSEFGSDDLYATVDQLAISPDGSVAGVERWYRQGLSPAEHVIRVRDGELARQFAGRYPRWMPDGGLLVTLGDGSVGVSGCSAVELSGRPVHSAEWIV
ncbi:hypothetical protein [Microbacterium sp.]|uniref:hypothetical protein n=1 Tax=Microbacterium sp. TaxID=51671 RepID=UPI003C78FB38